MASFRIIKSGTETVGGYSPFDRGELHAVESGLGPDFAEELEAEPDPAEILAAARDEAERKVQEAYAEGLRRGEAAGKAAFLEQVGEAISVFASAAEAIRLSREQFLETFEPAIAMLGRAAAERILRRELRNTDLELVQKTIQAAVRELTEREQFALHLNPADVAALEENGVDIAEAMADVKNVRIVPDETVSPGGCVIDSESLYVDARLEEQLARIFDELDA